MAKKHAAACSDRGLMAMELVWPAPEYLASYVQALEQGWSPNNVRPEAGREELDEIRRDAAAYLARQIDREAKGPAVILPDGSAAKRIPGFRRWMWDGEFCGVIGFRWQPGTNELPPHVLGHIGFAVVPWKRGRGYATRALALLLDDIRADPGGLTFVELTADPANVPSQRVITANGGQLVERFAKSAAYGGDESLRFRIALSRPGCHSERSEESSSSWKRALYRDDEDPSPDGSG